MDEKSYKTSHRVVVINREEMSITGVSDVISFDESLIVIETDMGILEIKGNELHVNQLNLENGEMSLTGDMTGLEYDDKQLYKKGNRSLIGRLFG